MTKSSQIAVGVLLVVVIIGGVWYAVAEKHKKTVAQESNYSSGTSATSVGVSTASSSASTTSNAAVQPATSASNDSDATISQDTANIDSQMNGLNSDNANAQQSLTPPAQ